MLSQRARHAASTILTKSIRALPPGSPGAAAAAKMMTATRKWPAPCGQHGVVVVHDEEPCELAQVLIDGYKQFFESDAPGARELNGRCAVFNGHDFLANDNGTGIASMVAAGGTVVLVQNHAFQNQTHTYRLRLPLMESGLRVVEHPHLLYATSPVSETDRLDDMCAAYVESCCIDPDETDAVAKKIGRLIDGSPRGCTIQCRSGAVLDFGGPLEKCLFNTGKFFEQEAIECGGGGGSGGESSSSTAAKSPNRPVGGSFPFGEVITESVVLSHVSGELDLFAFPNTRRTMSRAPAPFRVTVERGVVADIAGDAPQDFLDLCGIVRDAEGDVVVRELGIGLNRALGRDCMLGDVTSFERQWGVHLSLGLRHPLFVKAPEKVRAAAAAMGTPEAELRPFDFTKRRQGKFHLDVFLDVERLVAKNSSAAGAADGGDRDEEQQIVF